MHAYKVPASQPMTAESVERYRAVKKTAGGFISTAFCHADGKLCTARERVQNITSFTCDP
jgi:hypothetical protein